MNDDMARKATLYCGTYDALKLKLRGGNVSRYHVEGRAIDQTVAEHTWRLLVILLDLWPNASPDLVKTALYHDVAEGFIGDVHAPLKRALPGVENIELEYERWLGLPHAAHLSALEQVQLKCADYLELLMYSSTIPTSRARDIVKVGEDYIYKLTAALPVEDRAAVTKLMNRIRTGEFS